MSRKLGLVLAIISAFVFTSCKVKVNVDPGNLALKCEAQVADEFSDGVDSGQPVNINVTASGGKAPYQMLGTIGTFDPSTTISKTYTNTSDEDITVEDVAIVNDSIGFTTQCGFSVVVHPVSDDDPTLSVVATPATFVPVGSTITLTATATNLGSSPTFSFSESESNVEKLQSGNTAVFWATDTVAHTFNVLVTASGNGEQVSQSVQLFFTTNSQPSLSVVATPSASVPVGGTITLTATATNLGSSPVFTFTETESNVDKLQNGNVAVFWATNSLAHTFDVVVTASGNGQQVSQTVHLSFTTSTTFSCTAHTDFSNYRVYYGPWQPVYDGLYNSVLTWATIPSGVGVSPFRITNVSATPHAEGVYQSYNNDPLMKEVFFYEAGQFQLILTVKDAVNTSTTCTTPSFNVWW